MEVITWVVNSFSCWFLSDMVAIQGSGHCCQPVGSCRTAGWAGYQALLTGLELKKT